MKRFLFYITGLLVLLQAASCVQETEITPAPTVSTRSVQFHFLASAGDAETRALNSNEDVEVNNIYMLAFIEESPGVYEYAYTPVVSNLQITGGSGSFEAVLKVSTKGQKFLIIANPGALATSVLPQYGESYEAVTARLECVLADRWPANLDGSTTFTAIPMCGNTQGVIISSNTIGLGSVSNPILLVRMLARIDVSLAAALTSPEVFKLTGIYLFRPYKSGLVHYNSDMAYWSAAGDTGSGGSITTAHALKAYVPTGVEKVAKEDYFTYTVPTADKFAFRNSIYMFEALGVTDLSQATAIVIGGEKASDPGNVRYYRIDIKTLPADATLPSGYKTADILRNFWYDIVINSVTGDGSDTPIEAYDGDFTVNATVTPYNQAAMKTIIDKQYHLTVDPLNLEFDTTAGQEIVTAETDYNRADLGFPAGIQVSAADIVFTPAVAPGDEWLTLSDENSTSPGDLLREIGVNVLANPGATRSAKIYVKAGNMTQVVSVVQKGFFLRITDEYDVPITELKFNSKNSTVGVAPTPQKFKVTWEPADQPLTITKTRETGSNAAFFWQNTTTQNMLTVPAGGEYTFTIDPAAFTATHLSIDPFYSRISSMKFALDDGNGMTADASILLSQINYALIPEGFIDGFKGQEVTAAVKTNANWTVTKTDLSGALASHTPVSGGVNKTRAAFVYKFVSLDVTGSITFRFENSENLFDPVDVTVKNKGSIIPFFARSNVIKKTDGTLAFAVTEADNNTIPSNVQGLYFVWGGLVGYRHFSIWGSYQQVWVYGSGDESFIPSEYTGAVTYITPRPSYTLPYLHHYFIENYPNGYDVVNGVGDICRYISDKGWVSESWRIPTRAEMMLLKNEIKSLYTTSKDAINHGMYGTSTLNNGMFYGPDITGGETASDIAKPKPGNLFFPYTGAIGDQAYVRDTNLFQYALGWTANMGASRGGLYWNDSTGGSGGFTTESAYQSTVRCIRE